MYGNETVLMDLAEVTGAPWLFGRSLAQVTVRYRRSVDDDFPVVNRHRKSAQRLANGTRATFLRTVDCNDRAAFRKSVAFVDGNSQAPGGIRNLPRDGCPSHRDDSKRRRRGLADRLKLRW